LQKKANVNHRHISNNKTANINDKKLKSLQRRVRTQNGSKRRGITQSCAVYDQSIYFCLIYNNDNHNHHKNNL